MGVGNVMPGAGEHTCAWHGQVLGIMHLHNIEFGLNLSGLEAPPALHGLFFVCCRYAMPSLWIPNDTIDVMRVEHRLSVVSCLGARGGLWDVGVHASLRRAGSLLLHMNT